MRTSLDLDPQEGRWGREGNLSGTRRDPGHRVSPSCETGSPRRRALKGQRRRPPSNSRKGGPGRRGTQWARGPRGRAWARLQERKGKQRAGGGGGWPGGPAGPAAGRDGGEAPAKERGFPTADPTKTQGESRPSPGRPVGAREEGGRFAPQSDWETPSWGRGVPVPTHAGKSRLPAAARAGPCRSRPPCGPAPVPSEAAAALESPGCRQAGGDAAEGKVGFGYVSFYRVGDAPVRAGARVAGRAGSRGPGPAGQALRSQGPSPRLGPG